MYDFEAQGDDELTVAENEHLVILERENDDWWKMRNDAGHEGVVPASYVEATEGPAGGSADPASSAALAAQQEEDERLRQEEEEAEAVAEAERQREAAVMQALQRQSHLLGLLQRGQHGIQPCLLLGCRRRLGLRRRLLRLLAVLGHLLVHLGCRVE